MRLQNDRPSFHPVHPLIRAFGSRDLHHVKGRGQSAAAFYATWAHEQVHSTGHASRLKRDLGGAFGKPRYAREELVAELGAVLLGDRLEIGSELQSHAAYLEHWIALLQAEPQVLFQVLGEARQAVELIAPEGVASSMDEEGN